ncbi:MAG: hypothetical protein IPJ41_00475 [Phycisphaerales bacterium]|nr:hypothetical protein [Phycisphaerales bacterium]
MGLTISTRALGRRRPLLADFSVPPPIGLSGDGDDVRLRDVIAHVVRHEVGSYKDRQEARRFDRALTARQIDEGEARGKIDPAGRPDEREVDGDQAVDAALQAFEDGLYLVIIDGRERRNLDEVVRLSAESRLAFVRLVFLAGA